MADSTSPSDRVRTAELISSLCLATDLGMGFPFEHGLQATLTTMRLCEALGVDDETASRTYYACLLMYAGCTVDGEEKAEIFEGTFTEHVQSRQFGSMPEILGGVAAAIPTPGSSGARRAMQAAAGLPRAIPFLRGHFAALCEVAGILAEQFDLPESICGMFPLLTERWDGSSLLRRAKGEDVPLPMRIVHVARDATYQRLLGDDEFVVGVIGDRAGGAFDPEIVAAFTANASDILGSPSSSESMWDETLAAEPKPRRMLEGSDIDRALSAIGLFADLSSAYFTGHSSGVADLAARAAQVRGLDEKTVSTVRRSGYLHDVGRAAVAPEVWGKAGPLNADEREQVRMHTYHTDRVLAASQFLAPFGPIATTHHERLDGSGYHRGLEAASLSPESRLLAAADAFHSKTEPRPYREAMSAEEAIADLARKAEDGAFDAAMVAAVAEAAGEPPPQIERPAGLTDREVEVVGLLARGLRTKQIARELDIATRTADRHIQNSYRKMGVSSRAAATLFASEHGLIRR